MVEPSAEEPAERARDGGVADLEAYDHIEPDSTPLPPAEAGQLDEPEPVEAAQLDEPEPVGSEPTPALRPAEGPADASSPEATVSDSEPR